MPETEPVSPQPQELGSPAPDAAGASAPPARREEEESGTRIVRSSRQRRYLSQAVTLEEGGPSDLQRATLLLVIAALVAFLVWAAVTPLTQVAVAPGEVIPSGRVRIVQHLEGGIVDEILVRQNQLVEKGELMVRLVSAEAVSELEQARAREMALRLRAERLQAFVEGRAPNFDPIARGKYGDLVADQRAVYRTQQEARRSARAVIETQIAQRQSQISELEKQLATARRQEELTSELLAMREELMRQGLVSKVVYLETKRALVAAQGEILRLQEQLGTNREALAEQRNRLRNLEADLRREAGSEMGLVTSELAQVRESLLELEDRVARLEVRAPVRGLVQDLRFHTLGAVVSPGDQILRVVPVDERLLIEARLSTHDNGMVAVGQDVKVKFSTYDFSRYGYLIGKLSEVSATTFLDEEQNPYYRAVVELARPYLGDKPGTLPVMPGMTVQADIITGRHTLLQYLLKPILVSLEDSFDER